MSELTITAAGFTIQPLINQRDGAAIIRWAYNRSFLTSENIQVNWGTLSSGFAIETPCAIASGLVTVDQDTLLWTTDDAQDINPLSIGVSAWLLSSRRVLLQQLTIANKAMWIVPSSQIPTTSWAEFSNYNQANALFYTNPTYYNAPQTDFQIRNYASTNYATDAHLGGVFLSVPADIATDPVVWGANDPLVRDAIVLQGVDVSATVPSDGQVLTYNQANNDWEPANAGSGTGNVISNEISSVDGQVTVASGTGGKTIKFQTDVVREIPTGAINSSNLVFTLAHTPIVGSESVYLQGLLMNSNATFTQNYTISGDTITFEVGTTPQTGNALLVSYRY